MKRFMPLMFVPFVAVAACGDDATNTPDGSDATIADTTRPDGDTAVEVTPGVSALTGVNTNVTGVTEPERNAACDDSQVDNGNYGTEYPWGGFTEVDTTYTCNACPGGRPEIQGRWKLFTYDETDTNPDYLLPDPTDYAEVLYVDGNTWYTRIFDSQASPKLVEARGYYACLQQPEHPNKHLLWVITEATPNGAQGWEAGKAFGGEAITQLAGDWDGIWFDDPRTTGAEKPFGDHRAPYCQFGATKFGKTCADPFN